MDLRPFMWSKEETGEVWSGPGLGHRALGAVFKVCRGFRIAFWRRASPRCVRVRQRRSWRCPGWDNQKEGSCPLLPRPHQGSWGPGVGHSGRVRGCGLPAPCGQEGWTAHWVSPFTGGKESEPWNRCFYVMTPMLHMEPKIGDWERKLWILGYWILDVNKTGVGGHFVSIRNTGWGGRSGREVHEVSP